MYQHSETYDVYYTGLSGEEEPQDTFRGPSGETWQLGTGGASEKRAEEIAREWASRWRGNHFAVYQAGRKLHQVVMIESHYLYRGEERSEIKGPIWRP